MLLKTNAVGHCLNKAAFDNFSNENNGFRAILMAFAGVCALAAAPAHANDAHVVNAAHSVHHGANHGANHGAKLIKASSF